MMLPVEVVRRTNGVRDLSKTCLWQQDGYPEKCKPDEYPMCSPCRLEYSASLSQQEDRT